MTVSDLIELLKDFDPNAEVVFAYNYGDRSHTTVCETVHSVGDGKVTYSDYHRQDKLIENDGWDEDGEYQEQYEDVRDVVVLQ